MRIPTATYRLQFNSSFGFKDARNILGYLHNLGITDVYASPIFKAVKGSTHGYDVVDPNKLNEELGSESYFEDLMREKERLNMGWIQDIVPNHMAFDSENKMLMDVLEYGNKSRFYDFFDIAWDHPDTELSGKVMVPILGRYFETALADSKIQLDIDQNGFYVKYYDHQLPLAVSTYSQIFKIFISENALDDDQKRQIENLANQFDEYAEMPFSEQRNEIIKKSKEQLRQLSEGELNSCFSKTIDFYNGENSFLHSLLDQQYFKLTFWKRASKNINYRRFFYLNDFISMRADKNEVFEYTHQLVLKYVKNGYFSGLRIDHIDGLSDPQRYLELLREAAGDKYIVVEKILQEGENLPKDWPIEGTTGYEFADHVNKLFCCKDNEQYFDKLYENIAGPLPDALELVYEKKKDIIQKFMIGDVKYLTYLYEGCELVNEFETLDIQESLIEIISSFGIYRTYVTFDKQNEFDKKIIREAVEFAIEKNPKLKDQIELICNILLVNIEVESDSEKNIQKFIQKFQQLTSPAMAKGFEDTFLYSYNKFTSLNEVGSWPDTFGITMDQFDDFNRERFANWKRTLNATSTHDTKRGEDVRARLNVLSEMPQLWQEKVYNWININQDLKKDSAPDQNDQYLLYQTMIGAVGFEQNEYENFKQRLKRYFIKAIREAKTHTNWIEPNEQYESGCCEFIEKLFDYEGGFWKDFEQFQRYVSKFGICNSLSQLLIKMASVGIPDFYQGSELWDLNLVDPDNRRAVDFDIRKQMLNQIESDSSVDFLKELFENPEDGKIKLWITHKLLKARSDHEDLFQNGEYLPVKVYGINQANIISFARKLNDVTAIVLAGRFFASLSEEQLHSGAAIWQDTYIEVPENKSNNWRNVLTDEIVTSEGHIETAKAFKTLPLALLISN